MRLNLKYKSHSPVLYSFFIFLIPLDPNVNWPWPFTFSLFFLTTGFFTMGSCPLLCIIALVRFRPNIELSVSSSCNWTSYHWSSSAKCEPGYSSTMLFVSSFISYSSMDCSWCLAFRLSSALSALFLSWLTCCSNFVIVTFSVSISINICLLSIMVYSYAFKVNGVG